MNVWHDIERKEITPESFPAVVEISRGSKCKYELDKETGLLKLDRVLHTSTHYPANYGFIPKTLAGDSDPLDVLVLCTEAIIPLTLVRCYPIGAIVMTDADKRDEKIIAIPFSDPYYKSFNDPRDLPPHVFDEIRHFFGVYKQLEHMQTAVGRLCGVSEAKEIISSALLTYEKTFPEKSAAMGSFPTA